jgi:hypothetical protein
VFAFANVFHFFAHELARLSGRRLAFEFVLPRAFDCFFFWHNKMVSPLATHLDVKKAAGVTSRRCFIRREPILSSALLAATATLLAATAALLAPTALFFTLALLALTLLTFALLSLSILLLSALLSGAGGFARFVWILLCVHDAFAYY